MKNNRKLARLLSLSGCYNRKFWVKKLILFLLLAGILVFIIIGLNSTLETTRYTITSTRLPSAFDGFKIVHISDFHLKTFGDKQKDLIDAVWKENPDMIALTGDIINRSGGSMDNIQALLAGISGKVPLYAIAGNHESENPERLKELSDLYSAYGVVYLEDSRVEIKRGESSISVYAGKIQRNTLGHHWITVSMPESVADNYNILLHHYGDGFDDVVPYGYDLVLAGHVHGGIIRMPLIGGIVGNDGLFPKYDAGIYRVQDSVMVLSRGLGDMFLPRFYNRSELVSITLLQTNETRE